jgi:hypothetical protein
MIRPTQSSPLARAFPPLEVFFPAQPLIVVTAVLWGCDCLRTPQQHEDRTYYCYVMLLKRDDEIAKPNLDAVEFRNFANFACHQLESYEMPHQLHQLH